MNSFRLRLNIISQNLADLTRNFDNIKQDSNRRFKAINNARLRFNITI